MDLLKMPGVVYWNLKRREVKYWLISIQNKNQLFSE